MNQDSSEITSQYFRQNKFDKLDKKGGCVERRSKKFN